MVTFFPMICGEVDRPFFRKQVELKTEQAGDGFMAAKGGQQQYILAQWRGKGNQAFLLRVGHR